MTEDFDTWLTSLERQIERIPALHGDHADLKGELRRLVAYARDRAAPPPEPEPEPAPEPDPATAPAPEGEKPPRS
jgi:hypothetical protein